MAGGLIRFLCSGVLLTFAVAALEAGGWVVITVMELPDHVVVGKSVTLTYAVRQHGVHLLDGLTGRMEARSGAVVVRTTAVPSSKPGHYSAMLTLPSAGDWAVDLASGFSGPLNDSRITLRAIDQGRPAPDVSEAARGQRLFVAKGCITCHVHGAVEGRSLSVGPALTAKRYPPEYLKRFLAHPSQGELSEPGSVKMPDLELQDREITSLMAFINAVPKSMPLASPR